MPRSSQSRRVVLPSFPYTWPEGPTKTDGSVPRKRGRMPARSRFLRCAAQGKNACENQHHRCRCAVVLSRSRKHSPPNEDGPARSADEDRTAMSPPDVGMRNRPRGGGQRAFAPGVFVRGSVCVKQRSVSPGAAQRMLYKVGAWKVGRSRACKARRNVCGNAGSCARRYGKCAAGSVQNAAGEQYACCVARGRTGVL